MLVDDAYKVTAPTADNERMHIIKMSHRASISIINKYDHE